MGHHVWARDTTYTRATMRGVGVSTEKKFASVFDWLFPRVPDAWWIIDTQSPVFEWSLMPEEEQDRALALSIEPPSPEYDIRAWGPGVFPSFADRFIEDEFTWLLAVCRPEADVRRLRDDYVREPNNPLSRSIERWAGCEEVEILLFEPWHGTWEVYSRNSTLLEAAMTHTGGSWVDSTHWNRDSGFG